MRSKILVSSICAAVIGIIVSLPQMCSAQSGTFESWGSVRMMPGDQSGYVCVSTYNNLVAGVKRDGSIDVWGVTPDMSYDLFNVPKPNTGYAQVSVGSEQIIALRKDGSVVIWGRNDYGQCNPPQPNSGFVSVKAEINHGLSTFLVGLKSDGSVVYIYPSLTNNLVFTKLASIASNCVYSYDHLSYTVGIKPDGSLQFDGDSGLATAALPQPNSGFTAVSCGRTHAAALRSDGSLACWGDTAYGKCAVPSPNSGFIAVAAGNDYTAAVDKQGSIVCWGNNQYGQCDVPSPNEGFVNVYSTGNGTIGVKSNGKLVYWGVSSYAFMPCDNSAFTKIRMNGRIMGLKSDGTIAIWGQYDYQNPDKYTIPIVNSGIKDIAVGDNHNVVLKNDGSVVCWGANESGQCNVPEPNANYVAVAASGSNSFALTKDGRILRWGASGQFDVPGGNSNFVAMDAMDGNIVALKKDRSVFCSGGMGTLPNDNQDFVAVAAGQLHCIGLKADGSVVCWGTNSCGQCNVPVPNQDFVAVYAGQDQSMAVKRDGSLIIWGGYQSYLNSVPEPNNGIIGSCIKYNFYCILRKEQTLSGLIGLSDFIGNKAAYPVTAVVSSMNDTTRTQVLDISPDASGNYSKPTWMASPYQVKITSPHFLPITVTNVSPSQPLNVDLVNGDADGDGMVNLFDYVVLDSHFDTDDAMADLDGDGKVNLFDYVVVDRSFGAVAN